jgi:hypothetical protein
MKTHPSIAPESTEPDEPVTHVNSREFTPAQSTVRDPNTGKLCTSEEEFEKEN